MGDRANVRIREGVGDPGVWLYTHYDGSRLLHIVRDALKLTDRWGQAPYVARTVFTLMIEGAGDKTTGYGIGSQMGDYQVVDGFAMTVDCDSKTVTIHRLDRGGRVRDEQEIQIPFAKYAQLDDASVDQLMDQLFERGDPPTDQIWCADCDAEVDTTERLEGAQLRRTK